MSHRVKLVIEGRVAVVTLDRADKHNALDLAMFEALAATGDSIIADSSVRAVVLHGAGSNFCAGIDTAMFAQAEPPFSADMLQAGAASPANFFQRAAWVWREVPVPVVCAITGIAYGGGLQLALGADLRFAAPDAQLAIMEIKWGIIPDMAITATLARSMRLDVLKELAFSGRVVAGDEAARIGLVTAVHADPLEAAMDLARQIAGASPDAVRGIKQLFDAAGDLGIAASLKLEAELQLAVLGGANQREAVLANVERRQPRFLDPGS